MDALVARLQPPRQLPSNEDDEAGPAEWGSMGGYGNLSSKGLVRGMAIPRVPDVSIAVQR